MEQFQTQRPLPNATLILVLGILSIVLCFVLGVIALVKANQAKALYVANPGAYTIDSMNNVNIGRKCAIVGLILQCIGILFYLIFLAFFIAAI
ncbi:MAG TPA: hypothetical protein VK173_02130 [Lacibacter sp.]|nr:hypothetical protein [Lacibacter sp.]